jgi:hypothetical protein
MFTLRSAQLPLLVKIRDKLTLESEFFHKLLSCSFCTGFHAGWLAYLLVADLKLSLALPFDLLTYSFASASFCYVLDTLLIKLESDV